MNLSSQTGIMLGQPRNMADANMFPTNFSTKPGEGGVLKPVFVQTMELIEERLFQKFNKTDCSLLYICSQPTPSIDGHPKMYSRFSAFGDSRQLVESIVENMYKYDAARELIVEAFTKFFLKYADPNDSETRDFRRALEHYYNKATKKDKSRAMTKEDIAELIDSIATRCPERSDRITMLQARAKQYRKSGMNDTSAALLAEVARLQQDIIDDKKRQQQLEIDQIEKANKAEAEMKAARQKAEYDRDLRLANLEEAQRCKDMRANERLIQQQWEHYFASLERRQKFLRAHIEKATEALKELNKEQYAMQQKPQFNVHAAAKQRAQKISARQAERKCRKKKGKVEVSDTRSCSPMLTKK